MEGQIDELPISFSDSCRIRNEPCSTSCAAALSGLRNDQSRSRVGSTAERAVLVHQPRLAIDALPLVSGAGSARCRESNVAPRSIQYGPLRIHFDAPVATQPRWLAHWIRQ